MILEKWDMYLSILLVCLAFRGRQPSKLHTVDHIDRNPSNNHESNLRWATKAEQKANQGDRKVNRYSTCITQVQADGTEVFTWFKIKHIAAFYGGDHCYDRSREVFE